MRRDPKLKDMCRRIASGHEKVKRKLPIWTPSCAEFAHNHRAVKDALKPMRRLMLDFDEKGHSAEILKESLRLQQEGKWEILLVEESVRPEAYLLGEALLCLLRRHPLGQGDEHVRALADTLFHEQDFPLSLLLKS